MFGDSSVESTSFIFTKGKKREEDNSYSQTADLLTNEKETQTGLLKNSSSQTETIDLTKTPHYDVDKLASFLVKIYPNLIEELGTFDSTSRPIKHYPISNEENTPVNLHCMELKNIEENIISSLSISTDGKSLAVAFSQQNHESSCMHTSEIHIYKTNSDDYSVFPLKHILKTNSCTNLVSFHPKLPFHLACGLRNGQIFIWSITADSLQQSFDNVLISNVKHSDAVTSITWFYKLELFVTSGRDGLIIFWNYNIKKLTAVCCCFILAKYINPEKNMNDLTDILCIGLWKNEDPAHFIVGTEGGNILHCSISKNEMTKTPYESGFFDPFVMKYESQGGIITCIACSEKDVFATCGTNYEIRIYKSKKKFPFHVIHTNFPILEIGWFQENSAVIACWGYGPHFYFNNVKIKAWLPSYSVRFKNPDSNITSVAIFQKRSHILAVGTDKGEISIWSLPNLSAKTIEPQCFFNMSKIS